MKEQLVLKLSKTKLREIIKARDLMPENRSNKSTVRKLQRTVLDACSYSEIKDYVNEKK